MFARLAQTLTRALTRLLSISPGEEQKMALLFGMHLVFFVGLRWGDTASSSLFAAQWHAKLNDFSFMFIALAVLAVAAGSVYNYFAARLSHERMLVALAAALLVWLASVQILLRGAGAEASAPADLNCAAQMPAVLWTAPASGPCGWAYLYFSLGFFVLGDILTLHILIYISDFYDTRTAKRALPVLLSAGILGAILAGATVPFLTDTLQLSNAPLAWGACLLIVLGFVALVRWRLPGELARIEQARQGRRPGGAARGGMRAGLHLMRQWGVVRWIAFSTVVLVVLMRLLTTEATVVLNEQFGNDAARLAEFNGQVESLGNAAGLLLSFFVFAPLLSRLGVGTMNLLFPLLTLGSVAALNFLPSLGAAVAQAAAALGRLTDRVLKKVFRNPLEAMLFNSVPADVKGQARGFINAWMVALGTLLAGLIMLAAPSQAVVAWLALGAGLLFVLIAWRVRTEYARALSALVVDDELAVFRLSREEFERADPAIIEPLVRRLRETDDDDAAIVLAELLYDVQGAQAVDLLCQLARERGPAVRAHLIQIMGEDRIRDPGVRALCLDGLGDENENARRAAAVALAQTPNIADDEAVLNAFLPLLESGDETIQASLIPPLLASGDFYYMVPAMRLLSGWLDDRDEERCALGLRVLAQTGDERLVRTLVRYADGPAPSVRQQAAELIGQLAAHTRQETVRRLGLGTLRRLLNETDEMIRLAAIHGLGRFHSPDASAILLEALRDPVFEMRREACAAMHVLPGRELSRALHGGDVYAAECAAYLLARAGRPLAQRRAVELCERLAGEAYALHALSLPLLPVALPGPNLLHTILQEQAHERLDRLFWLVGALSEAEVAEAVRDSLGSEDVGARVNAAETLESLASPRVAQLVGPWFDGSGPEALARIGAEKTGVRAPNLREVFQYLWPGFPDGGGAAGAFPVERGDWLTAAALYALSDVAEAGRLRDLAIPPGAEPVFVAALRDRLRDAERAGAPLTRETAALALSRLATPGAQTAPRVE